MKYARIANSKVVEVTALDPSGRFHPSIIWVECADEVEVGYGYVDGVFSAPDQSVSVNDLKDLAADKRWRVETGGTTWNGWQQATDDRGQAKCAFELQAIDEGLRQDGDGWKFNHGFEALTNVQMHAVVMAVRAHVKASYEAEAAILTLIDGGTITTLQDVENWYGWPDGSN